jgi:hypothetical protein
VGSGESPTSLAGLAEPLSTVKVNLPTPVPTQTLPGEDITSVHTPITFQSLGLDVVFDTLVPSYRGLIDPIHCRLIWDNRFTNNLSRKASWILLTSHKVIPWPGLGV